MTDAHSSPDATRPPSNAVERPVPLTVAALASLGAGVIHAAAIGGHAQLPEVQRVFTIAAVVQIGWGALVLARGARAAIGVGILANAALLAGWVLAKVSGIGFVDGLAESQPPTFADSSAAGLAATAVIGGWVAVVRPHLGAPRGGRFAVASGIAVLALATPGMSSAASPNHHGNGDAGADHHAASAPAATADEPAVAVPYDPALPIDLGGIDGVTPTQQAAAENIIANTLTHLPQFADPAAAEAAGFASIHDGGTGYEHFIQSEFMSDGRVLDPDRPESLVYQVINGERTLVAAMYMAEPGTTLETVDDFGGPLTQWHIHGDLCFTSPPASRVAGLTDADGNCAAGLVKPEAVPMIHVWIRPHPCGPFAALEGIAGGQIAEGEARLCDAAHGGH